MSDTEQPEKTHGQRSLAKLLAPLEELVRKSPYLSAEPLGVFKAPNGDYTLRGYVFSGPPGGGETLRIGLFAGINGDQPEGIYALIRLLSFLHAQPELATGYRLYVYPVCNPTGFEDNTPSNRYGHDLNSEFWRQSTEPEVLLLQQEILARFFHGIITLQTDSASDGVYGLARGATLTKQLLKRALATAGQVLPRNEDDVIGGASARDGVVKNDHAGFLGAPPNAHPRPFEISLVLPKSQPETLKEWAAVLALQKILEEYRQFIAYAADL